MKFLDYEVHFRRCKECLDSMEARGLSLLEELAKLNGAMNRDLRLG